MIELRTGKYKTEYMSVFKPGQNIVVFDTETTGFDPEKCRVIEFSSRWFTVGEDYSLHTNPETDQYTVYIKPDSPVPKEIEELTGITNELLADKPSEEQLVSGIHNLLNTADVCVGHNINFDIKFIDAMMTRHGLKSPFKATADTLKMARDLIAKDKVENHKNETLVKALGLDKGIEHFHDASDDVLGTARLLYKFLRAYYKQPDNVEIPITDLTVSSVSRWEKDVNGKHLERIYVNTNAGSCFFSETGEFCSTKVDIDRINMAKLIADVLAMTGIDRIENILEYGKKG